MPERRSFFKQLGSLYLARNASILGAGTLIATGCDTGPDNTSLTEQEEVSEELAKEMYDKALSIVKTKVRGGPDAPFFKKPYLDAASSNNIFLWDTCFMASYAKYHQDELPIHQALDNFYNLQSSDGWICREYLETGEPLWPKNHPVSINPPLLAFAELELYSQKADLERLKKVYPALKKNFQYLRRNYKGNDDLYFGDTLGMGMDNIHRYPKGWEDDGKGRTVNNLHPDITVYDGLDSRWNVQGRLVDFSSQMAFFCLNLQEIASLIGKTDDTEQYQQEYRSIRTAVNENCWNDEKGFYFDLGYGEQIERYHIGAYWTLLAEIVPGVYLNKFLSHLTDPYKFGRHTPVPALAYSEEEYKGYGAYWQGGVWAPTNYMVLRGLQKKGQGELARQLAKSYYQAIAQVYRHTGTFWEYYAPEFASYGAINGGKTRLDFCGWTALAPISIYKEFVT